MWQNIATTREMISGIGGIGYIRIMKHDASSCSLQYCFLHRSMLAMSSDENVRWNVYSKMPTLQMHAVALYYRQRLRCIIVNDTLATPRMLAWVLSPLLAQASVLDSCAWSAQIKRTSTIMMEEFVSFVGVRTQLLLWAIRVLMIHLVPFADDLASYCRRFVIVLTIASITRTDFFSAKVRWLLLKTSR